MSAAARGLPAELTVIVPCYNERPNVAPMVARLDAALSDVAWEVLFVDDNSPDGTAGAVRALAALDARVRCIRRIGRRGLSSAVIEGALASSAAFLAVIDGDLQHDETCLPAMLALLRADICDVVVGSRHVAGGAADGLAGTWRHRLSDTGIRLAQTVLPGALSDPMSGFFMVQRPLFEQAAPFLTATGFKILVDLLLSAPITPRVKEVPYRFHARTAGESKLDVLVLMQFAGLLVDKALHGMVPLRFIAFALVGGLGIIVNLVALNLGRRAGLDFATAEVVATLCAMAANFWLNNTITYRDQRLRGRRFWPGLVLFMVVCGVGNLANIGIAGMLYRGHAGWTPAAALGAAIGVVWNFAVSNTLVWRR